MTLLVVLGAGASYDSVATRDPKGPRVRGDAGSRDPAVPALTDEDHQARPPLADQLFDDRPIFADAMERLPRVGEIAAHLQVRPSGWSVERVLDELHQESTSVPRRRQQLAAVRFYISHVIRECERKWIEGSNVQLNLATLFDMIEARRRGRSHPPMLVTFNYDRILERVLTLRGRRFESLRDYITTRDPLVVKLHGSVGWRRFFPNNANVPRERWDRMRIICEHIESFPPAGNITLETEGVMKQYGDLPYLPAIAVPVLEKREFECPPDHVEALRRQLTHTRAILCIGWRAGEQAFIDMIAENVPPTVRIVAACGSEQDSRATTDALLKVLPDAQCIPFDGGFSKLIEQRAARPAIELAWDDADR